MPWKRIILEKLTVTQLLKKFPGYFMEPQVSLPHSQDSTTGPDPEPHEPS